MESNCTHYFDIDGYRVGKCKKCGLVVDYKQKQAEAHIYEWGYYNPDVVILKGKVDEFKRIGVSGFLPEMSWN